MSFAGIGPSASRDRARGLQRHGATSRRSDRASDGNRFRSWRLAVVPSVLRSPGGYPVLNQSAEFDLALFQRQSSLEITKEFLGLRNTLRTYGRA